MSRLLSLNIDVTKIPKHRLFKGKKGTYLNAEVWINDEPDGYGNDGSIAMSQSKEERESKERKIYIGSAKKIWGWSKKQQPKREEPTHESLEDDEDLPF